jgi:DNA-binding transcriptional LysR family regulator
MDRLDCILAFLRVVEAGSFAEAARQLGLTASAVSKRISQLEAILGVQLLQRTTRNVSVTDLGALYYERAVDVITLVDEAQWVVQQGRVVPSGHLRISSPTSFGALHLAPALCEFQAQYPGIVLEVILNDRVINPVDEGFDVCLQDVGERLGSMIERRLFPLRRVVCAAPSYVAKHGTPEHPRDLAAHQCIHYSYLESGLSWRFESSAGGMAVPINPFLSTNNGRIMLDAVLQGQGIAVLPTFLASQALQSDALVPLLLDFPFPLLHLSAVYPRRRYLPSKVKVLIDFLALRFGPEPSWDRELDAFVARAGS